VRIFVVGDNESLTGRIHEIIQRRFECPVSHVMSLKLAAKKLPGERPDVTVLVLSPDPEKALSRLVPKQWGRVVAVGKTDPRVIVEAMRHGAKDFVDEEKIDEELEPSFRPC
jgi:hypothetical protein